MDAPGGPAGDECAFRQWRARLHQEPARIGAGEMKRHHQIHARREIGEQIIVRTAAGYMADADEQHPGCITNGSSRVGQTRRRTQANDLGSPPRAHSDAFGATHRTSKLRQNEKGGLPPVLTAHLFGKNRGARNVTSQ